MASDELHSPVKLMTIKSVICMTKKWTFSHFNSFNYFALCMLWKIYQWPTEIYSQRKIKKCIRVKKKCHIISEVYYNILSLGSFRYAKIVKKTLCWFCERVLFIYSLFLLLLFCLCVNWNIRWAIDSKRTKHTRTRTGYWKTQIHKLHCILIGGLTLLSISVHNMIFSFVCLPAIFYCCVLSLSPSILQTNGQKATARYTFLSFCIYDRSAMWKLNFTVLLFAELHDGVDHSSIWKMKLNDLYKLYVLDTLCNRQQISR